MNNMFDLNEKSDSNSGKTLAEAKDNFKKFGASDYSHISTVRKPFDDEKQ